MGVGLGVAPKREASGESEGFSEKERKERDFRRRRQGEEKQRRGGREKEKKQNPGISVSPEKEKGKITGY
jgi:hypothetical protein